MWTIDPAGAEGNERQRSAPRASSEEQASDMDVTRNAHAEPRSPEPRFMAVSVEAPMLDTRHDYPLGSACCFGESGGRGGPPALQVPFERGAEQARPPAAQLRAGGA